LAKVRDRFVLKQFRLDAVKLERVQKLLNAETESEAIERALDLAIREHERNRVAAKANERFMRSGITIGDVYGVLED
jgi:ribosome-binding protein aMBF1 (putative translation factor)